MDQKLQKQLEAKGVHFTHLAKELVALLVTSKTPLSIHDIQSQFKKKSFNPYRSSIFRQLSRLTLLGFTEKNIFSNGKEHYCWIDGHHHHFECKECGQIEKIEMDKCCSIEDSVKHDLKKPGYQVTSHHLTFAGLCPKCS